MPSPSESLQKAIYDALIADAGVAAITGASIFDGRPPEGGFPCLTFGPSDYLPDDDATSEAGATRIDGRVETLQIDAWVRGGERLSPVRALADAVKVALHEQLLALDTHALARLSVTAVRVFRDQDGLTGHGVITVTAEVEER